MNVLFGNRAENGTRTRDPNLGKVVLYQLSYFRVVALFSKAMLRYNLFFNLQTFRDFFLSKIFNCTKNHVQVVQFVKDFASQFARSLSAFGAYNPRTVRVDNLASLVKASYYRLNAVVYLVADEFAVLRHLKIETK